MAIKFGSDGTLYCNSVRYNYRQAYNIVYNNCDGENSNAGWSTSSIGGQSSVAGYKAGKCFKIGTGTNPIMRQTCFQPTAGHKYYGSVMLRTDSASFSTGDCRYEWWCNDTDLTGKLTFGYLNASTNGGWVKVSSLITAGSTMASGTWMIRAFQCNPNAVSYICKMIIVDLTYAFGSGNEPTKAWCDANILEHEKLCAYNYNLLNKVNNDRMESVSTNNALSRTGNSYPRCKFYDIKSSTSSNYFYLSGSKCYYSTSQYFYIYNETRFIYPISFGRYYYYALGDSSTSANDDICVGVVPSANHRLFNTRFITNLAGDTNASNSKRISTFFKGPVNANKYTCLIMINTNTSYYWWMTEGNQIWATDALSRWATVNNVTASIDNVNKAWCDRWLDGRDSPIIHIKDPSNRKIKFLSPLKKVTLYYDTYTSDALKNLVSSWFSQKIEIIESEFPNITPGSIVYGEATNTDFLNRKARILMYVVGKVEPASLNVYILGFNYEETNVPNGSVAWQYCEGDIIECNDIEIHPEIDYISFDKTGTIKCKKLVTNF